MEQVSLPEKIDYAWCARYLTTCKAAQVRLRRQHRILMGLLAGVIVCLLATVIFALLSHWLTAGLSVGTALLVGSGAWLQRKRVNSERTWFVESGQYVEFIREILPLSWLHDISAEQHSALIDQLMQLPIFEELR